MCFHPHSDLQLTSMTQDDIIQVIKRWMEQTAQLGEKFKWVSIFENKGVANSNNHPHCQVRRACVALASPVSTYVFLIVVLQIWATSFLPNDPSLMVGEKCMYTNKFFFLAV